MEIDLSGNIVKLVSTVASDLETIIKFEEDNAPFVHKYSHEKHLRLLNSNDCLHLSVRRIQDDTLIGHTISFGAISPHKELEFRRIAINEKERGYGREAMQLIKKICFKNLKFHRLWLDVYEKNKRAIKLYESEGFVYEGTLREKYLESDGYHSLRLYAILEKEYFKMQ